MNAETKPSGPVKVKGLGNRLRQWRKRKGLKLKELSAVLGVSQGSLSDIENEKSLPSADTLLSIEMNTDLCILYLLSGRADRAGQEKIWDYRDAPIVINLKEHAGGVLIKSGE